MSENEPSYLIHLQNGKWQSAISEIASMSEEQKTFRVRNHLARAQFRLGQKEEARRELAHLKQEQPTNVWLQKDLIESAIAQLDTNATQEAVDILLRYPDIGNHSDLVASLCRGLFWIMPAADAVETLSKKGLNFSRFAFRALHESGALNRRPI